MCKESRSAVQVVTPDTLRHEQHDLVLIKMEYPPEITTHATSPPTPPQCIPAVLSQEAAVDLLSGWGGGC